MLGSKLPGQTELLMAGSLHDLIPDDHVLARVDRVLDLSWLRAEVRHLYAADGAGRPGIDPEAAVRLMLAGFLLGIVHDRRLLREAQVNIAIRWFAGYGLRNGLPDHSSLTRIRQRCGAELFRQIFTRTVRACVGAGIAKGEVVHIDATLIRADVGWESLGERHADAVLAQDGGNATEATPEEDAARTGWRAAERDGKQTGWYKKVRLTDPDATMATNLTAAAVNLKRLAAALLALLGAFSGLSLLRAALGNFTATMARKRPRADARCQSPAFSAETA